MSEMWARKIIDSPIGKLIAYADDICLRGLHLLNREESFLISERNLTQKAESILLQIENELALYFAGNLKNFTIPIAVESWYVGLVGEPKWPTDFQKKVWKELTAIPYGQTRSYGEIAQSIHNVTTNTVNEKTGFLSQAVGGGCNKNPYIIVVPCHRVVSSKGSLTGYAVGITIKQQLLELEKNNK